jgi:hypothetical protein
MLYSDWWFMQFQDLLFEMFPCHAKNQAQIGHSSTNSPCLPLQLVRKSLLIVGETKIACAKTTQLYKEMQLLHKHTQKTETYIVGTSPLHRQEAGPSLSKGMAAPTRQTPLLEEPTSRSIYLLVARLDNHYPTSTCWP